MLAQICLVSGSGVPPVYGVQTLTGDGRTTKIDLYSTRGVLVDNDVFVLLLAAAFGWVQAAMELVITGSALYEVTFDEHSKAIGSAIHDVIATSRVDGVHAATTTQPVIAAQAADRVLGAEANDHVGRR